MRKKLLCVILAGVLAVGGAACNSSADSKSAETQEETKEEKKEKKEKETEEKAKDEEKETTEKEETTAEETTPKETEAEGLEFQTGTWEDLTFTNPWLGLTITFPGDSRIFTEEEMEAVLGAGQEILVNNGNVTESQLKLSEVATVYDFMVALPDGQSNVQLAYENTHITAMGRKVTAADYLDVVGGQLVQVADMQYEIGDKEEVELAGQTFSKMSATVLGGAMYQDYYCIAKDGHMAVMTVSYLPESQDAVDELIAGITGAE